MQLVHNNLLSIALATHCSNIRGIRVVDGLFDFSDARFDGKKLEEQAKGG